MASNHDVIRPLPDRCQMHGRTLYVPVTPEGEEQPNWICIVCVTEHYWNEDITEKVKKLWPAQFKLGTQALREHLLAHSGGIKRKGASGV
jgi:hypothetical protein